VDLKHKIKNLPVSPGIYLMKDSLGNIIYVGKAKNLKNRVSQYFQKSKAHAPKILKMIQNIEDFDIIETDTELDAFVTECKYIKEIKPMYNSQMKNDKGYSYIKINMNDRFPRITISQEICDDKAKYFGPYTSLHKVEQTVGFLKDYYKLRKCTTGSLSKRTSGCLNYELKLCLGVCSYPDKTEEYMQGIQKTVKFLELNDNNPIEYLHTKMLDAAEKFDFEKAARYREYLIGIKHVMNKQRLLCSSQYDRNIIAVELIGSLKAKAFFIKGNKMLGTEIMDFETEDSFSIEQKINSLSVSCFYEKNLKSSERLGQRDIDEAQIIYSYLKKNRKCVSCFWVPASWFAKDKSKLEAGIQKLVAKVEGVLYGKGEITG
jgi:excinuclease ABC subunit C